MNNLFSRYDWPNHIWALRDRLTSRLASEWWTFFTHCQLRLKGIQKIGVGLSVVGYVHVLCRRRDSIRIGRHVTLISRFRSNLVGLTGPVVLDTRFGGVIEIGDFSGMSGTVISSRTAVRIGNYVKVGGNVRIFDHDFHATDWATRRGEGDRLAAKTRPVFIGDDVFVGTNAILLKGSEIGDRSIVAAGSVVLGLRVPSDSLVAGNPAKVICALL